MKGKIIYLNNEKHIGKILGVNGKVYFLHHSKLCGMRFEDLYVSMPLTFEVLQSQRPDHNDNAISIESNCVDVDEFIISENPFLPDRPVNDPLKFAGRRSKLIEGITHLVNKKCILISGDRGIGKSSFANQLLYSAHGDRTIEYKYDINNPIELDYKSVNIKISKEETVTSLSQKIVSEFVNKYNLSTKVDVQHEFSLSIYKSTISHQLTGIDDSNVINLFNYDMASIYDKLKTKSGLLIFIDELENINPDIELALFIKNVTEYMNYENKNLIFIIAGIPSASTMQFKKHQSFIRLFMPIDLASLSPSESYEFIDLYLRGTRKRILDHVKENISNISSGLPINLQLLGFYSYQVDMDNNIKMDDFRSSVDYIITTVKKHEYQNRHESIGFGEAEDILKHIIIHLVYKEIRVDQLVNEMPEYSAEQINNTLEILAGKELLTKHAKGRFYIKDYLFVEYLKKYYSGRKTF